MILELSAGGVGFTSVGLLMIYLDYTHGFFPHVVFWIGIVFLVYLWANLVNVLYYIKTNHTDGGEGSDKR